MSSVNLTTVFDVFVIAQFFFFFQKKWVTSVSLANYNYSVSCGKFVRLQGPKLSVENILIVILKTVWNFPVSFWTTVRNFAVAYWMPAIFIYYLVSGCEALTIAALITCFINISMFLQMDLRQGVALDLEVARKQYSLFWV